MKTWKVYDVEGYAADLAKTLNAMEADGWTVFSVHPVDLRGHKDLPPAWNVVIHKEEQPARAVPPFRLGDVLICRGDGVGHNPLRVVGVGMHFDTAVEYTLESLDSVSRATFDAALVHNRWVLTPKETR